MHALLTRVGAIAARIRDLTHPGGLLGYPEFVEVFLEPERYLDEALELLAGPEPTEIEKAIVALAMQRLPLSSFVAFAEQALRGLESGVLTERVFDTAVFPTYEWNTVLAENFADPAVRRLLERVIASSSVGEGSKAMAGGEILSGKAAKAVLELRSAGVI